MKRNRMYRLLLITAACFFFFRYGGEGANATTLYDGTTLIVDGKRYERSTAVKICEQFPLHTCTVRGDEYAGGVVLVSTRDREGIETEVEREFVRVGLKVRNKFGSTIRTWIIEVPVLTEEQWVTALRENPIYDVGVSLNHVLRHFSSSTSP